MIDPLGCSIPYVYSCRSIVYMCWCTDCFSGGHDSISSYLHVFFKVVVGCFSRCSDLIFYIDDGVRCCFRGVWVLFSSSSSHGVFLL
jgi:hypothetical protein